MSRGHYGRLAARAMLLTSAAAMATACSSEPPARTVAGVSRSVFSEDDYGVSTSPRVATSTRIPKGGGMFKLGEPYKVAGRWYVPREDPNYVEYGVASWYGADFHGRRTANGEIFDADALTAAHPTMPLPCYALVTNLDNGKSVLVRVNDRGPYVNDRVIDMSYAAATQLGYASKGRARVRVQYAGRAPLNGDDTRERRYLAEQQWRENQGESTALAANEADPLPRYDETPVRNDAATLPADASDRWSPMSYRAALAGKSAPAPRPFASSSPQETADLTGANSRRMSLSAPPPVEPFAAGRDYVQVGIFRERSNAERLRRELGSLGPIEVSPMQVGDGSQVYRVRVGPFPPGEATRAQSQIATYGVADAAIVTD